MQIITVVVLPLAIYALQLLGKVFGLAALGAGGLLLVKVCMDLLATQRPHDGHPALPPDLPASMHCSCCHTTRGPFRVHPHPDHRLLAETSVCESCYLTRLVTAAYMSEHYEPL